MARGALLAALATSIAVASCDDETPGTSRSDASADAGGTSDASADAALDASLGDAASFDAGRCTSSATCPAERPNCDTRSGLCFGPCQSPVDCVDPALPNCNLFGTCFPPCTAEADCTNPLLPHCNRLSGYCFDGCTGEEPQAVVDAGARFADWLGGFCAHICAEKKRACQHDLYQATIGPWDDAACMTNCTTIIDDDPRMIANFHCHAPTCEELYACALGPPRPVPEACTEMCRNADACGAARFIELSGGVDLCSYLCAGGGDRSEQEAACMAAAFGDECDVVTAVGCVPFAEWKCTHVCGVFNGHSGMQCPAGSPYFATFQSLDHCMELCMAEDVYGVVAAESCLTSAGCERTSDCWPPVHETSPECAAFCDGVLARCPDFEYPGPYCGAWCTQAQRGNPRFPECVHNETACNPPTLANCGVPTCPNHRH